MRRSVWQIVIFGEEVRNSAIGVAEEKTLGRCDAEKLCCARGLLHAQTGKLEETLCAREKSVFHHVRIKLERIAAFDSHDGHARPGCARALDCAGAAQRFVVGVRRDHQEHIGAGEAAEASGRCPHLRRERDGRGHKSPARAPQVCVYRAHGTHGASRVMRLKPRQHLP
jgi:hypothetical protein